MQLNPQSPQFSQDPLAPYRESVESLKKAFEKQKKAFHFGKGEFEGISETASALYKKLNKAHLENYGDLSKAEYTKSRIRNVGDLSLRVEQRKELESMIKATMDISNKANKILKTREMSRTLKPNAEEYRRTQMLTEDYKRNPRHLGEMLLQINLLGKKGDIDVIQMDKIKELESYKTIYPLSIEDQKQLDSIIESLKVKGGSLKALDDFRKILDKEFSKTPGFVEGYINTLKKDQAEDILSKNQDSYLLRFDERHQLVLSYIARNNFVHNTVYYNSSSNYFFTHITDKNGNYLAAKTISKLMEQVKQHTGLVPLSTEKEISKDDAEKILKSKPNKSYLLREDWRGNQYISYRIGENFTHIPIFFDHKRELYWADSTGKKKDTDEPWVSRSIKGLHKKIAKSFGLKQVEETRPPALPSRDRFKK